MIGAGFLWISLCLFAVPTAVFVPPDTMSFPPADPESQGLRSQDLEALANTVQRYVEESEAVGAELLVIKNRRKVLHEAYGWKDYEGDDKVPMEKNTIFNIRSMTKPVIGTAIQMLIDEGRLTPEDPISRYLPALDNDAMRAITVDHLLTHRSGLPLGPVAPSFHALDDISQVADRVAEMELLFEPGLRFQYSDPGADLLAALIAKVSGRPVDAFLQERILDPLGMAETLTVFDRNDPRAGRVAALFIGEKGRWHRIWKPYYPLYPFTLGSQSLYATVEDYARFLLLWLDRGKVGSRRLLSTEAVRRGLTPRSEMPSYPCGFEGLKVCYGQMWMLYVGEKIYETFREKSLPEVISHGGSDGTVAWAWPAHDLIVCYFTQSRGGLTAIDLQAEIDRLLIQDQE